MLMVTGSVAEADSAGIILLQCKNGREPRFAAALGRSGTAGLPPAARGHFQTGFPALSLICDFQASATTRVTASGIGT